VKKKPGILSGKIAAWC